MDDLYSAVEACDSCVLDRGRIAGIEINVIEQTTGSKDRFC